jgi:hypothetical protein
MLAAACAVTVFDGSTRRFVRLGHPTEVIYKPQPLKNLGPQVIRLEDSMAEVLQTLQLRRPDPRILPSRSSHKRSAVPSRLSVRRRGI